MLCVQEGYLVMNNFTELFDECIDVLIEKIDSTALKEEKSIYSSYPLYIRSIH